MDPRSSIKMHFELARLDAKRDGTHVPYDSV